MDLTPRKSYFKKRPFPSRLLKERFVVVLLVFDFLSEFVFHNFKVFDFDVYVFGLRVMVYGDVSCCVERCCFGY